MYTLLGGYYFENDEYLLYVPVAPFDQIAIFTQTNDVDGIIKMLPIYHYNYIPC